MSGRPFDWRSTVVRMTVVRPDFACPRGHVIAKPWGQLMHPSDWMERRNNGRTPLLTRHTLGTREAERDRRRQEKAAISRGIFEPGFTHCAACGQEINTRLRDSCDYCGLLVAA